MTEEDNKILFSKLIKENKYVRALITYDDSTYVRGYFTERIFEQDNGKLYYMLSKIIKFGSAEEKIIFIADDMDDEKHINAGLALTPMIHRYAPYYNFYYYLSEIANFLEKWLPNKMILVVIFLIILCLFWK